DLRSGVVFARVKHARNRLGRKSWQSNSQTKRPGRNAHDAKSPVICSSGFGLEGLAIVQDSDLGPADCRSGPIDDVATDRARQLLPSCPRLCQRSFLSAGRTRNAATEAQPKSRLGYVGHLGPVTVGCSAVG